jgi:hypothetical protein
MKAASLCGIISKWTWYLEVWSRENISSFRRNFKAEQQEEANLAVIRPAEYKEVDIVTVAEAQQHLTLSKRNKSCLVLTKF